MKKVLVTGCNGFLGRYVCSRFSAQGYAVSGIDVAGKPAIPLARFLQSPITADALKELGEPFDVIIHLAGPGTVSAADRNAAETSKNALGNMRIILESTRQYPDTLLLYPSSSAVYGDQPAPRLTEDMPSLPLSVYGSNKVADEALCTEYHRKYGSRIGIIRFFSIYGEGLRKQLLWDFSQRLADAHKAGKNSVPCFGTGEETRDYIHVDDVVRIFELLADRNADWLTINAGSGKALSVRQVLTALTAAYGLPLKLDFDGISRQGNPMHLLADVTRLSALGFTPGVSFETGIARYARWAAKELLI